MKGKLKIVCIVAICLCVLGCIWCVQWKRSVHSITGGTSNGNGQSSERINAVSLATVQGDNNQSPKNTIKRTTRFLELALQLVSPESRPALQKVIDAGVDKQSDSFARFSIDYMELLGGLKREGKLLAYYDALREAFEKTPSDINLLRMIAAISSIPSLNKGNEYEYYLSRLADRDTNEDVIFPYAKMQLQKGDAQRAYALIEQTVTEHPEQAIEILTNALRIFTEHKSGAEKRQVVDRLKMIPNLDPQHAYWCGETLFKDGILADAEYFCAKSFADSTSKSLKDKAEVKLCVIRVRNHDVDYVTIERLKELAENSVVPAVRKDARRALISLNVDLPNQPTNAN